MGGMCVCALQFCSVSKDAAIVWTCSRTPDDVEEHFRKTQGGQMEGVASEGRGEGGCPQGEGSDEVMNGSEGSEEEEGEESRRECEEDSDDTGSGDNMESSSVSIQQRRDQGHPRVVSLSSVKSSSDEEEEEEEGREEGSGETA